MVRDVESLWGLLAPYLEAERLELDDLELAGRGSGTTLRVVVDADGGVDVERLAEVSGGLSRLLDARSDLAGPYRLEVSSPGLERRLRRPRHYQKSVGRELVVKAGDESLRGVVVEAGEQAFIFEVDGERRSIPYATVSSARTVFRTQPKPKPGRK